MPFCIPTKRTSLSKSTRFSKYKDIEDSPHFVLQKRKRVPEGEKWRRGRHRPIYRCITKGPLPYYEVAYSDDLDSLRAVEWHYIVETLPTLMPPYLVPKARFKWLIAHFTQVALENGDGDGTATVDDKDSDDEEEVIQHSPTLQAMSITNGGGGESAPLTLSSSTSQPASIGHARENSATVTFTSHNTTPSSLHASASTPALSTQNASMFYISNSSSATKATTPATQTVTEYESEESDESETSESDETEQTRTNGETSSPSIVVPSIAPDIKPVSRDDRNGTIRYRGPTTQRQSRSLMHNPGMNHALHTNLRLLSNTNSEPRTILHSRPLSLRGTRTFTITILMITIVAILIRDASIGSFLLYLTILHTTLYFIMVRTDPFGIAILIEPSGVPTSTSTSGYASQREHTSTSTFTSIPTHISPVHLPTSSVPVMQANVITSLLSTPTTTVEDVTEQLKFVEDVTATIPTDTPSAISSSPVIATPSTPTMKPSNLALPITSTQTPTSTPTSISTSASTSTPIPSALSTSFTYTPSQHTAGGVSHLNSIHPPSGYPKLVAGATVPFDATGVTPVSWSNVEATTFDVRVGPAYKKNKLKKPSAPAMYECVGVDLFRSECKIGNVSDFVDVEALLRKHVPNWQSPSKSSTSTPPKRIIKTRKWVPKSLSSSSSSSPTTLDLSRLPSTLPDGSRRRIHVYDDQGQHHTVEQITSPTSMKQMEEEEKEKKEDKKEGDKQENIQEITEETTNKEEEGEWVEFDSEVPDTDTTSPSSPPPTAPAPAPVDENEIPPLLILTFQIPSYDPGYIWSKKDDGDGFSIVFYYTLTPHARDALANDSTNAAKMYKQFLIHIRELEWHGRFKAIPYVVNPDKSSLGRAMKKLLQTYNAKPFLTGPHCHYFTKLPGILQVDIDVHHFCFMARKAAYGFMDSLRTMIIDIAFVVEATLDTELPEQILGCTRLNYMDPNKAISIVQALEIAHQQQQQSKET